MPVNGQKDVNVNGSKETLYYIGFLAKKLNRTTVALRMWENKGIIPKTWFRDKHGRRMYTAEMIDIIVKSAESNKITRGKSIAATNFSVDCHNAFDLLYKKYFGGSNNDKT